MPTSFCIAALVAVLFACGGGSSSAPRTLPTESAPSLATTNTERPASAAPQSHASGKSGVGSVEDKQEVEQIHVVLLDYIEGTAHGEPDRVRRAFHEDLKLYSIKGDALEVWDGKGYIDKIEAGKRNTRQGKIVFVDHEKDAAVAKIEILVPGWRVFTDYLMLLKVKGRWQIIHKAFTYRPIDPSKQ